MASPSAPRSSIRIVLGLVGLALILDFLFYTGFYASDDIGYLDGVRAVAGDASFVPDIGNTRMGVTLPDGFIYWITGGSISAVAWFHVLYHLVLVVLAYVLARLLHDDRAGLIAAALVAINPLLYGYAGAVLPDNATSCWLAASMIMMIRTQQRAPAGDGIKSWNRQRFKGYVIAGAFLGGSYMCKETALIMTVPAAILIMSATPLRNLVWIQNGAALALGLLLVVILDVVALRIVNGDWLSRMSLVTDSARLFIKDMEVQGTTPIERFRVAISEITNWMPWLFWIFVLAAVGYGVLKRRNVGVMAFFWWPVLYLTIGSTSFTKYLPATIQGRYYAIVMVPAAVMTAAIASHLLQRWRDAERPGWFHRLGPRLVVVAVIAAIGIRGLAASWDRSGRIYKADEVRAFVAALEIARDRHPEYKVVLSPYYLHRMKPLLYRFPVEIIPPAPPYVYIELVGNLNKDGVPEIKTPHRTRHLHTVWPPRNRIATLADAFRRMFSSNQRKKMTVRSQSKAGAGVFLINPPDPSPSASR